MSLSIERLENALAPLIVSAVSAKLEAEYPISQITDEDFQAVALAERAKLASIISSIAGPIATAVLQEITNNAVVTVASVSGVTAGVDSSGSGSGTVG